MGLFESLDAEDTTNIIKPEHVPACFSTVESNFDTFLKKIEDMTLIDNAIRSNILFSYEIYFDYNNFTNNNTRATFQKLWTNERFLKCVLTLVSDTDGNDMVKKISKDKQMLISINKINFDYQALDPSKKSDKIEELLMSICNKIDYSIYLPIATIIDTNSALFITVARYSSFEEITCAYRLNAFLTRIGYKFSVENIVYIYSRLFRNGFSTFFTSTMTKPMSDLNENETYNYNNISTAVLQILESMPSTSIRQVLMQYSSYISLMVKGSSLRFSMRDISKTAYPRIANEMNQLEFEGIFIV